ncbi:MAG TPA: PilW family protein [Thiobacillaceae bacterium]
MANLRARQSGMSLVEIMVAVVLGLIGILIITQAYISSDNFNRSTLGEGGAQTNGLIALYTIERDARMAGYGMTSSGALACGQIYWYYDPNYSANTPGWSGNPAALPAITLAPIVITTTAGAPDTIQVMYSSTGEMMVPTSIAGFNASSSEVDVDGTTGFNAGDLVLMVGSSGCTLGKITQVQPGPSKLQLNPGISAPYNPPAWGAFPTTYAAGDSMLNLGNPVVRIYSIANFATNQTPTLQITDTLLSAGGTAPVDLVEGIVDLKAQYGRDTGTDNVIDTWDNTAPADWMKVLAVRIAVLARIGNYEKPASGTTCDATSTMPTWAGSGARPFVLPEGLPSCYRYRVFETTIPIRNVIWSAT